MRSLQTPRLQLRRIELPDRTFLLRLLNDPAWLANIGDRGVRSEHDAESYIRNNIWSQYDACGYGMYALQPHATLLPIGLCGLVRREFLPGPDLGFALLPDHVGHGYAEEAARAVMRHAGSEWGIGRLYAIVNPENHRSIRLLERLGFSYDGRCSLPQGGEIGLYATHSHLA